MALCESVVRHGGTGAQIQRKRKRGDYRCQATLHTWRVTLEQPERLALSGVPCTTPDSSHRQGREIKRQLQIFRLIIQLRGQMTP